MAQSFGTDLRGPVETGDHTMFRPVLIIEEPTEGQTGTTTQVSERRQWRERLKVTSSELSSNSIILARVNKYLPSEKLTSLC